MENNDELMMDEEGPDGYPVTRSQIEYLQEYRCGGKVEQKQIESSFRNLSEWEEVGTLEGQEASKLKISGLENNDEVMFRVSASNNYGLSAPVEEPDFHTVLGKHPLPQPLTTIVI